MGRPGRGPELISFLIDRGGRMFGQSGSQIPKRPPQGPPAKRQAAFA